MPKSILLLSHLKRCQISHAILIFCTFEGSSIDALLYVNGIQHCICNSQFIQIENGFDPKTNSDKLYQEITGAGKSVERAGNSRRRQRGKWPPSQVAGWAQRGQVRLRARLGLGLAWLHFGAGGRLHRDIRASFEVVTQWAHRVWHLKGKEQLWFLRHVFGNILHPTGTLWKIP